MAVKKKLDFQATSPIALDDDTAGASRDIWLATWGVIAIFVIVTLVLFFTGSIGAITGAGVTLVPEQNACLRGNAVTDIAHANEIISTGGICERGLLPSVKCCWWP
jgi:hypothetical protein